MLDVNVKNKRKNLGMNIRKEICYLRLKFTLMTIGYTHTHTHTDIWNESYWEEEKERKISFYFVIIEKDAFLAK